MSHRVDSAPWDIEAMVREAFGEDSAEGGSSLEAEPKTSASAEHKDEPLDRLILDWDLEDDSCVAPPKPVLVTKPKPEPESLLGLLRKTSITGSSKHMREQMLADAFVLSQLAILGQWTSIYGAPNTGKTLITLWLLREQILAGKLEASNVFYVNADDNHRGVVDKLELAESWGMEVLVPGLNGFTVETQIYLLSGLAAEGDARGIVFCLDTLKKFADLMSKQNASAFGLAARAFVSAGGTLIALAHCNKHKDSDGKSIYSGTSDIIDDSDCAFIIDQIGVNTSGDSAIHTVEFTNKKARGDVATTAAFSYERIKGQTYASLLDSVKRVGELEIEKSRQQIEDEQDAEIISAVNRCINNGTNTKSKIVSSAKDITALPHGQIRTVLDKRTGRDYLHGHRWSCRTAEHNAQIYSILPAPSV
ncbi:MAG: hypothetical protein HOM20_12680 [Porticoccaceae bacterium]|nr:hypothetical protein [Porticoccaceae bacterium]